MWTLIECTLGLISVSIPPLRPLARRVSKLMPGIYSSMFATNLQFSANSGRVKRAQGNDTEKGLTTSDSNLKTPAASAWRPTGRKEQGIEVDMETVGGTTWERDSESSSRDQQQHTRHGSQSNAYVQQQQRYWNGSPVGLTHQRSASTVTTEIVGAWKPPKEKGPKSGS
jgi:hypothetical protein